MGHRLAAVWGLVLPLCLAVAAMSGERAVAAQLLMFEQPGCPWCRAFDREVATAYTNSPLGKRAPLRRVDITRAIPPDLDFVTVERFTPVFVLVEGRREIGRIRGYPGDHHFWGLIDRIFDGLDAPVESTKPDNPS